MRKIRTPKLNNFLANYIKNNLNKYMVISLIFIIGLVVGIFFSNNMQDDAKLCVSQYINTFIENLKTNNVNIIKILQNSLFQNLILIIIVWFLGSTVLGFPIVILIIGYRGFIFGYTISCVTLTLGIGKSILFCVFGLFIHNVLFLFALFSIGVSSIKFCQNLIKDSSKSTIKYEIIRHSIFCMFMLIVMEIGSLLEVSISYGFLNSIANWLML